MTVPLPSVLTITVQYWQDLAAMRQNTGFHECSWWHKWSRDEVPSHQIQSVQTTARDTSYAIHNKVYSQNNMFSCSLEETQSNSSKQEKSPTQPTTGILLSSTLPTLSDGQTTPILRPLFQDNLHRLLHRMPNHSGYYWSKKWWGGSGISWSICKSFALHSR